MTDARARRRRRPGDPRPPREARMALLRPAPGGPGAPDWSPAAAHHATSPGRRADIDGLRAVAVLAIIAYHAGAVWMPGGFAGVDVFFVISGFAITRLLLAEHAAEGRISPLRFWARRARRILPALFVVLAVSSALAWALMLPLALESHSHLLAYAALFAANIALAEGPGYFSASAQMQPLLHLWSLGVGAQFYIAFPVLAAAVLARAPHIFPALLALLLALSFGAAVLGVAQAPEPAFFLPQMRAWQVLTGALIAAGVAPRLPPRAQALAGVLGAMILAACFAWLPGGAGFPGFPALAPVAGAALILLSEGRGPVGALLSLRAAVWVGLISYALYLWHWPLLVFARIMFGGAEGAPVALPLIAAIALAWLSWRFVERPFRRPAGAGVDRPAGADASSPAGAGASSPAGAGASSPAGAGASSPAGAGASSPAGAGASSPAGVDASFPPRMGASSPAGLLSPRGAAVAAAGGTALFFAVGVAGIASRGAPERFAPEVRQMLNLQGGHASALDQGCAARGDAMIAAGGVAGGAAEALALACRFGDPAAPASVMVWGDEMAMAIQPAIDAAAGALGVGGVRALRAACAPIPGPVMRADAASRACAAFNALAPEMAALAGVRVAVLAGSFAARLQEDPGRAISLVHAVEGLAARGIRAIIVPPPPRPGFDVPDALARRAVYGMALRDGADAGAYAADLALLRRAVAAMPRGTILVDLAPVLCPDPGAPCPVTDASGAPLLADDAHLSRAGAALIAPALSDALSRALAR
jgi:peptidoglycan/LPS O-acetylase OafA/YrhL